MSQIPQACNCGPYDAGCTHRYNEPPAPGGVGPVERRIGIVWMSRAAYEDMKAQRDNARASLTAAQARIAEVERERDLAVAHDSQPYPTAEAYEKACAALDTAKERIAELEECVQECAAWWLGIDGDGTQAHDDGCTTQQFGRKHLPCDCPKRLIDAALLAGGKEPTP